MRFVDSAQIVVTAGDGGRGCVSYAQPPYHRAPAPDGGDGGRGGHVIVRADGNVATLLDFYYRHEFAAGRGAHGGSNGKTGARGADCLIPVPVGTVLYEAATNTVLRDLIVPGEDIIVARGGAGGLGNGTVAAIARRRSNDHRSEPARAATRGRRRSPTSRAAPEEREAALGQPGETRQLRLELKLIADVGLIGLPNAGKSSLLARLSTARPKIGAYPFTTRYPVLGVVDVRGEGVFVACDIPGLIEGAHAGRGLGIQFLRHIERTRLLVHLIDMAGVDGQDPVTAYRQVNRELASYSRDLPKKPQVVVANKMDLPDATNRLTAFRRDVGQRVWPISCATGDGLPALRDAMWQALQELG